MEILTDACLAFLASVGIWTLGRMALQELLAWGARLCAPRKRVNLVREADVWTKKDRRMK
jgi:hypothetical protein